MDLVVSTRQLEDGSSNELLEDAELPLLRAEQGELPLQVDPHVGPPDNHWHSSAI